MKLLTKPYETGFEALTVALALILLPSAFSLLFADPAATTAAPFTANQSGTGGFIVNTGTSNGLLGASGTGAGSVPLWNGVSISAAWPLTSPNGHIVIGGTNGGSTVSINNDGSSYFAGGTITLSNTGVAITGTGVFSGLGTGLTGTGASFTSGHTLLSGVTGAGSGVLTAAANAVNTTGGFATMPLSGTGSFVSALSTPGFFFTNPAPVTNGTAALSFNTNFATNGFPYASGTNALAWGAFGSGLLFSSGTLSTTGTGYAVTSTSGSTSLTVTDSGFTLQNTAALVYLHASVSGSGAASVLTVPGLTVSSTDVALSGGLLYIAPSGYNSAGIIPSGTVPGYSNVVIMGSLATNNNNVVVGFNSSTGGNGNCVVVGEGSQTGSYSTSSYQTIIGSNATVTGTNQGVLGGNTSTTTEYWNIPGSLSVGTTSSATYPAGTLAVTLSGTTYTPKVSGTTLYWSTP